MNAGLLLRMSLLQRWQPEPVKQALEAGGISPDDVDLIIVCTSSPDVLFPSTACFVQNELKAFNCAAYDISAVCSGFVFGLSIAEQYLKNGRYENILLIGSEVNSRIVDWTDRSTCILFGDGAGALLLKRVEQENSQGIFIHAYLFGRTFVGSDLRSRWNWQNGS